jgi:hypothetical protein
MPMELRYEDGQGEMHRETLAPPPVARGRGANGRGIDLRSRDGVAVPPMPGASPAPQTARMAESAHERTSSIVSINIYAYGITRQRLEQAARRMKLPLHVVDDLAQAQALVTLKTYYRRHQRPISDAEERGLPVYVLRSNSITQMENFLAEVFNVQTQPDDEETNVVEQAMHETQSAIQAVLSGSRTVDLAPQSATVRRMQHEMARQANLISHSYGKEPYRRVRIFRE